MRILTLTVLTLLCQMHLSAQPWLKNLPAGKTKSELTLPDYQKAFETYWAPFHVDKGSYIENGVKKKAPGWKQFKRWEYEMQSRVDRQTGTFPVKTAMDIRQEFEQAHPRALSTSTSAWTPLGPTTSFSGYSGIGRINGIAFHPDDLSTYWVGAAAGGLWQTKDNGASWTCLTDQNGVLAVSDMAITPDYATSNTLYIATGDRDAWDNRSIGVLKSTDGGQTWLPTGISYTIYEGQMVNRLLMDPFNPQILIAATTRGVFKTYDGGVTWNQQMTTAEFIDMEYKPGDSNTLYGSTKNGQIYICTDGNTFTGPVFNDGNANRIELAVSPNQPNWVYALASNGSSGLYGVFQSTDSGNSFNEVFSGSVKNLLTWESDGSGTGGQGWYDLSLAASPLDAQIVLVGGVNSWRSWDGGVTWNIINHWYGDQVQAVHADKHKLAFRSNGDVFECNDGGVYMSQDNGSNWTDKTNGIQISQMYRLGVSQTGPDDVITGLQDNGTKLHSGSSWFDVRGGDGMECLIDYTNDDIQYGTVYYGQIDRTNDHWQSSKNITPPDEGAWVTPYIIDPNDPATLYGGYNEVWKTTDRGDSWNQISSIDLPGKIQSMAIAASDSKVICIADYGQIWRTTNGGTDWANITANLPTGSAGIEYIAIHNEDPALIWVALSGYGQPGVYQSSDGGGTWTKISNGLPPIPVYSVVQNKQHLSSIHLYAGTELGVYFKDGDADWVPYANGLPNVRIGEIEIYYAGNPGESKLRAATYGRGLWETPIEYTSSPMVYLNTTAVQKNTSNVEPDQANQEILKVEVSTQGNLQPLTITSFNFNTEGCTDPTQDITQARLYYSGSSNTFSTAVLFGNAVSNPNGSFVIDGSQVLGDGKNNFWLTYDLPADAVLDHLLDAQCTSVTVDEPHALIDPAPAGYRTIGYEYCDAGAAQQSYEYISNVSMGQVNQHSDKGDGGYEDYTSQVIEMYIGEPMRIDVENGVPYITDQVLVWVDWNTDGDFDDNGENVFTSTRSGDAVFSGFITAPGNAMPGKTRMRVRLHDADNGPNDAPCGYATWGEVEDYTLRLIGEDLCGPIDYLSLKAQNIAGAYVDLGTNGTIIVTSGFDDANSGPQDIGFSFPFHCDTFSSFVLNTNGFIRLGDAPPSKPGLYFDTPRDSYGGIFNSNDPADANILAPMNINLDAGAGNAEYRVHTSGDAPYRVCTIQFKDVREAGTDPVPQFDNMEFQIKLYESTGVIEYVYGDWTPSGLADDFRTVACGIKGGNGASDQLLIVSKSSEEPWGNIHFTNGNYYQTSPIFYARPPASPAPDAGRTFRFIPTFNNDLGISGIYALGDASVHYSSPQDIGVRIENTGRNTMHSVPVTLKVTGANAWEETRVLASLDQLDDYIMHFPTYTPSANGPTTIEVSLPDDDNISNNTMRWEQNVNDFDCSYTAKSDPIDPMALAPNDQYIFLASYDIYGTAEVRTVRVYIPDDPSNVGQTVYGVVRNEAGIIVAQSDPYSIDPAGMGAWHDFDMPTPPVFKDESFFAGYAVLASNDFYYPLGIQQEDPLRPQTFFTTGLDGNGLSPLTIPLRLMISAVLRPTPPIAGIAGSDLVDCEGGGGTIAVHEYSGFIQWQESPDGISNWVNVTAGDGGNSNTYTTPQLYITTYYRAEISQPTFAPVYTNTVQIQILVTPDAAGPITGTTEVCQSSTGIVYFIEPIIDASDYIWSLPNGATGNSTTNSITVDFGSNAISGNISVSGFAFGGCIGLPSLLPVIVIPQPAAPIITSDGDALHSDAIAGNQWYDQNGPIAGATDSEFLALTDGFYYVIVTVDGCPSSPSNVIELIVTSTSDNEKNNEVMLYPNPVSGQLYIEYPGNPVAIPFIIRNAVGEVIWEGTLREKTIVETSPMAAGVYYLMFQQDGKVLARRFVKM